MNSGSLGTLRISRSRARVQTLSGSPIRFDQTVGSGQVGLPARMQRATDPGVQLTPKDSLHKAL